MRSIQAVVLFCFINLIAIGYSQAAIDPSVILGADSKIDPTCEIGLNSVIEANVTIQNDCIIGENVNVGLNATIGSFCRIESNSVIGDKAVIKDGSTIKEKCSIGQGVSVGLGSVFDTNSKALSASKIGSNVCIGDQAIVGENAVIEDNAVVHDFAILRNGTRIFKGGVIIKTPSSASLYELCVPTKKLCLSSRVGTNFILNRNKEVLDDIFTRTMNTQTRKLIAAGSNPNFYILREVVSFYLMKYHGRKKYDNNCAKFGKRPADVSTSVSWFTKMFGNEYQKLPAAEQYGSDDPDDSNDDTDTGAVLAQQLHFQSCKSDGILYYKTEIQLLRLLAVYYDNERKVRVKNDTYPAMMEDILKHHNRTVRCDEDC